MAGIFCRADFLESSRPRFRPIIMPGNSRENSEYKKQYRKYSLWNFRIPRGFSQEIFGFGKSDYNKKIQKKHAQCDFTDIPPGTYAIAVIHDENMNNALDTNWMGIPKEGYGFSNTTIDEFGAPAFSAASFRYDGEDLTLTIKLEY